MTKNLILPLPCHPEGLFHPPEGSGVDSESPKPRSFALLRTTLNAVILRSAVTKNLIWLVLRELNQVLRVAQDDKAKSFTSFRMIQNLHPLH